MVRLARRPVERHRALRMERPNSRFILTGDMNDPPDSPHLAAILIVDDQPLVNALANPAETRTRAYPGQIRGLYKRSSAS